MAFVVTLPSVAQAARWGPTWSEITGDLYSRTQMNRTAATIKQVDGKHETKRIVKAEPGRHEVVVASPMRKGFHGSDATLDMTLDPCKRYYVNAQFDERQRPRLAARDRHGRTHRRLQDPVSRRSSRWSACAGAAGTTAFLMRVRSDRTRAERRTAWRRLGANNAQPSHSAIRARRRARPVEEKLADGPAATRRHEHGLRPDPGPGVSSASCSR